MCRKKRGAGVFPPGTIKHSAWVLGKLRKLISAGCFRVSHDDSFLSQQPERAGSGAEEPEWDYFHHSLCMEVPPLTSTQPGFSHQCLSVTGRALQVSLLHGQNNKRAFTLCLAPCQRGNAHVSQRSEAAQVPAYSNSHLTTKHMSILRAFLSLRE